MAREGTDASLECEASGALQLEGSQHAVAHARLCFRRPRVTQDYRASKGDMEFFVRRHFAQHRLPFCRKTGCQGFEGLHRADLARDVVGGHALKRVDAVAGIEFADPRHPFWFRLPAVERFTEGGEVAHEKLVVAGLVLDLASKTLKSLRLARGREPTADEAGRLKLVPSLKLQPRNNLVAAERAVGAETPFGRGGSRARFPQLGQQPLIEDARILGWCVHHAAASAVAPHDGIQVPARTHPTASRQRSTACVSWPSDNTRFPSTMRSTEMSAQRPRDKLP